jgi:hypothetical protein
VLALGFIVGDRRDADRRSTVPIVRTYEVSPDHADEVRASLNRLLMPKEGEAAGFAQFFGNGLLLVRAPENFHRGIGQLIQRLSEEKTPARATIRLDYWLVIGREDKASNADSIPHLAQALTAIDKVDGPRKFQVLDHIGINALTGSEVEVKGRIAKAKSIAVVRNDLVGLKLDIESKLGEVQTTTQVKPGEFLVIGQSVLERGFEVGDLKVGDSNSSVYYVLRAEILKN